MDWGKHYMKEYSDKPGTQIWRCRNGTRFISASSTHNIFLICNQCQYCYSRHNSKHLECVKVFLPYNKRTLCRCTSINTLLLHPILVLHLFALTTPGNLYFLNYTLSFLVYCPLAAFY